MKMGLFESSQGSQAQEEITKKSVPSQMSELIEFS